MPDKQSDLLAEVLEKMIDCQMSNTQALTSLKSTIDESNENTKEISAHFTNGFRSEIKNHVTEELEKAVARQNEIAETLKDIKKQVESFKSIGFWTKVILGFVTALGVIIASIMQIIKMIP